MKKYIQEHKYVLLVLYLPIYLIWFALVERMVPRRRGASFRICRWTTKSRFCRDSFWRMCSGTRF
ncbi:MAG: hypothetical protein ACLRRN_02005 [Oscillospiraceae bacterium]